MKNTPSWEEIVQTAIRHQVERRIIRDSDGNPSRLSFRAGAVKAAAKAARRAVSREGAIDAICDVLKQYEYPVPLPTDHFRTS